MAISLSFREGVWSPVLTSCPWPALQVEKAGGYSSADGQCISSLDVPITEYDQRTQVRILPAVSAPLSLSATGLNSALPSGDIYGCLAPPHNASACTCPRCIRHKHADAGISRASVDSSGQALCSR